MSSLQYADVARQIDQAKKSAAALLANIRAAARYLRLEHSYSVEALAEVTDLHRNSVMKLDNLKWTPRPGTLELLEELILEAEDLKAGRPGRVKVLRRGRPPGRLNGNRKKKAKGAVPRAARKTARRSKAS